MKYKVVIVLNGSPKTFTMALLRGFALIRLSSGAMDLSSHLVTVEDGSQSHVEQMRRRIARQARVACSLRKLAVWMPARLGRLFDGVERKQLRS